MFPATSPATKIYLTSVFPPPCTSCLKMILPLKYIYPNRRKATIYIHRFSYLLVNKQTHYKDALLGICKIHVERCRAENDP